MKGNTKHGDKKLTKQVLLEYESYNSQSAEGDKLHKFKKLRKVSDFHEYNQVIDIAVP